MRVYELISSLRIGGAERALLNRLTFAPTAVTTTLVTFDSSDPALLREAEFLGVSVERFGDVGAAQDWISRRERASESVVIAHSPRIAISLLRSRSKLSDIPLVLVAHSSRLSDRPAAGFLMSGVLARLNRRADLHIAVSKVAAEGPWCFGASAVHVNHLGSTLKGTGSWVESAWPQGTQRRILHLGRLTRPKNLPLLVQAVGQLRNDMRDQGAHLLIVGQGAQEMRLRSSIERDGLQDVVSLAGSSSAPGDLMRSADSLVIASRFEGGPLTAYEAALAGTPLFATHVGVVPEVTSGDPMSLVVPGPGRTDLHRLVAGSLGCEPMPQDERVARALRAQEWGADVCSASFYRSLECLFTN